MAHRRVFNRRYRDLPGEPLYRGDRPWVARCLACPWVTFNRTHKTAFGYALKHVCGFR